MAPLLLLLLFGTVEGGLLMYQVNAANHTGNVGALVIATKGSDANADTAAIATMNAAGLAVGTVVTEYDMYMLKNDGTQVRDTGSCAGGTGCYQRYDPSGSLIAGNWDPTQRDVTNTQTSFVELDVQYTLHYVLGQGASVNMTARRYFRLEPQT